ncbi:hypothetical protein [Pseudotabrizicola alkalilacus]|uniref:Uncharacterized protein n=1 Tax=Pseudotabrizicola alkalilacus TaxID=2305252 RepID=A0A411Z313_9RHOB|nr:hypothetical protein [Pseudotabrizicola alkalilacus]RGP37457.1 hypothetical protein D1012_09575 [Pseudotabrizicola alkalilacus]
MRWVVGMMAGPVLWAVLFAAVYALHGIGCAWGWTGVAAPFGSLHIVAMAGVWLAGLVLHVGILAAAPKGPAREARLHRMGAWIGLVASGLTLLPVLLTSTCG